MGEQHQRLNPASGCTQDADLDADAVTGRLTPPLQICPWDVRDAGVLLLLTPPPAWCRPTGKKSQGPATGL